MSSQGIKIFLPEGDPNSLQVITVENWAGKAFVIPRAKLKEMNTREEKDWPGVYFLIGEFTDSILPEVYIGESEHFCDRLYTHDSEKQFWNRAVVFTGSIDKADVKFLEDKAIKVAKKINRFHIHNDQGTTPNKLSEFKQAAIENYFEYIKLVMAVLGYTLFQEVPSNIRPEEMYFCKVDEAVGKGKLLDSGEFIVFKGSTARVKETPNYQAHNSGIRSRLLAEGVLSQIGDGLYYFQSDYIFTSPSAAADTIAGRSMNGWKEWKDSQGKTLDDNKRQ